MKKYVACVNVGTKYPWTYVERLENMLRRHTKYDFEFICLTDHIRRGYMVDTDLHGWWAKLVLFKPHPAFPQGSQIVFLDLDTVVVDTIDFLFEYDGEFCILHDFWASTYNSSVMSIRQGFRPDIYRDWNSLFSYNGDQDWITHKVKDADLWQNVAPGRIGSYKADSLSASPGDFSIVCFHGDPKPHTFSEGWVHANWI